MTDKPTIEDSLLLCASDLQHSAIYDNHIEMQSCIRAVADRITALVSVIDGVGRAALAAPAQPVGALAAKAAVHDAVEAAAIQFISRLTGMAPPPLECAPPEVTAPFKQFADEVMAAIGAAAPQPPAQAQPVATIYVTEDGSREVDDWKVELPVGATTLYTAAQVQAMLAAPAQAVPAPGEPSEAPTQAQVDERSDTVWLFIRLGQKNIRRAITLLEIDSMRAPELAFGPLLLKAIAELRKT